MAADAKLSRPIRKARRRVEHAFRTAELALWGVAGSSAPAPALQSLEEKLQGLHPDDVAGRELLHQRLELLRGVPVDDVARSRYRDRHGVDEVLCTRTASGDRIYRVVAQTFPGHENYVYVVMGEGGPLLWDVGSGELSRGDILRGFQVIQRAYGETLAPTDIRTIIISHAHIDHFGDVAFFREHTGARVMVHELDARVLTRFEERMVMAAKDMGVFLARAGVSTDEREALETMYLAGKELFRSVEVDARLRHGASVPGGGRVIHTPGHCPGHLCLQRSNALLVADQVLSPLTPNLSPQSITAFNGLENYINGLLRLRTLDGVDHVLPAHAQPIPSLHARIDEILEHHQERLMVVQDACSRAPCTVAEVAHALFGTQEGYNVLLALTEAGAHVEYLYQYGRLRIANLDEVTQQRDPVLKYVTG